MLPVPQSSCSRLWINICRMKNDRSTTGGATLQVHRKDPAFPTSHHPLLPTVTPTRVLPRFKFKSNTVQTCIANRISWAQETESAVSPPRGPAVEIVHFSVHSAVPGCWSLSQSKAGGMGLLLTDLEDLPPSPLHLASLFPPPSGSQDVCWALEDRGGRGSRGHRGCIQAHPTQWTKGLLKRNSRPSHWLSWSQGRPAHQKVSGLSPSPGTCAGN